jgi:hypothetical protein
LGSAVFDVRIDERGRFRVPWSLVERMRLIFVDLEDAVEDKAPRESRG